MLFGFTQFGTSGRTVALGIRNLRGHSNLRRGLSADISPRHFQPFYEPLLGNPLTHGLISQPPTILLPESILGNLAGSNTNSP
jgi:hypothetical protein